VPRTVHEASEARTVVEEEGVDLEGAGEALAETVAEEAALAEVVRPLVDSQEAMRQRRLRKSTTTTKALCIPVGLLLSWRKRRRVFRWCLLARKSASISVNNCWTTNTSIRRTIVSIVEPRLPEPRHHLYVD
jgi:hypothetical protein